MGEIRINGKLVEIDPSKKYLIAVNKRSVDVDVIHAIQIQLLDMQLNNVIVMGVEGNPRNAVNIINLPDVTYTALPGKYMTFEKDKQSHIYPIQPSEANREPI